MKKKRLLITLAVALGAGACLLPWLEDVWLAFAYEEINALVMPFGEPGIGDDYIRGYKKRFSLLPGETLTAIDQPCLECAARRHSACHEGYLLGHDITGDPVSYVALPEQYWRSDFTASSRCICLTCYPERQHAHR